jgi:hypothetical protein
MVSVDKVLRSFYDLQKCKYFEAWTEEEEQSLAKLKDCINQNPSEFYKVSDIRFISQLLLDYLESLNGPLISKQTVNSLTAIVKEINGPPKNVETRTKANRVVFLLADQDQS